MTVLTIGRCGFDVELTNPSKWDLVNADEIRLTGCINAATLLDSLALRQQLLGLANNRWEQVVPLTWAEDPTADGWVMVKSVNVSTVPTSLAVFYFDFEARLTRVRHYRGSRLETRSAGSDKPGIGGSTPQPWVAVTDETKVGFEMSNLSGGVSYVRQGPGGSVRLYGYADDDALYDSYQSWNIAPADYYDMAAQLEVYDGTNYRTVIGDQVHFDDPPLWRMSNGILRISPAADPPGSHTFGIDTPSGSSPSSWAGAGMFLDLGPLDAGSYQVFNTGDNLHATRVLRNTPEEVTVQLDYGWVDSASTEYRFSVYLRLRRGACYLDVDVTNRAQWRMGAVLPGSGAMTAGTHQIHETADNADGNKWMLMTTDTLSAANKRVDAGAADTFFHFGVGLAIGGASATSPANAVTDVVSQWRSSVSEFTRVVA